MLDLALIPSLPEDIVVGHIMPEVMELIMVVTPNSSQYINYNISLKNLMVLLYIDQHKWANKAWHFQFWHGRSAQCISICPLWIGWIINTNSLEWEEWYCLTQQFARKKKQLDYFQCYATDIHPNWVQNSTCSIEWSRDHATLVHSRYAHEI